MVIIIPILEAGGVNQISSIFVKHLSQMLVQNIHPKITRFLKIITHYFIIFSSVIYRKVLDLNADSLLNFIKRPTLNLIRYNYNEHSCYINFTRETTLDGKNGKRKWYFSNKVREDKNKLKYTATQTNLIMYFNMLIQDFPN